MDTGLIATKKSGKWEAGMGDRTYTVKTPTLFASLGLNAMDVVRVCGVAVATAYDAVSAEKAASITLDTALKMYNGLRKHGYSVSWEDVVEFQDNGSH